MICLLPFCGYLSETSRMLELHRALRERGVPVRVATQGGAYESLLRQAGVAYDIVGPRMSPERAARFVRAGIGMGSVRQSMYTDAELRDYARAEADYFRRNGIRVAVTGFTLSTLLSTRLAGATLVTEHAGSWVPPAFERDLVPAPSAVPRPLTPFARRLANTVVPRMPLYTGGFNRVAAELGVPGAPSVAALVLGDLSLVPEAPEVLGITPAEMEQWRPALPAYRPSTRLRYSGPLYARLDLPIPDRVKDFLARPGPVVYVAVTSSPPRLVRAIVRSLCTADVRVLVAGTIHELSDLDNPQVMVAGVLPSHRVMPEVDLAVTAGGQGSVQTAMAAGTPLIGLPLQLEQELNVALVARLGAARMVPPHTFRGALGGRARSSLAGAPGIGDIAREMLADDRYRRAAQQIQKVYDGIDGPGTAAAAIIEAGDHA